MVNRLICINGLGTFESVDQIVEPVNLCHKLKIDEYPEGWDEWVSPGLFLVKLIDYHPDDTNDVTVFWNLESWSDL